MITNPQPGDRVWYFNPIFANWNPGPATVVRISDKRVMIRFDRWNGERDRNRGVLPKFLFGTQKEMIDARGTHYNRNLLRFPEEENTLP